MKLWHILLGAGVVVGGVVLISRPSGPTGPSLPTTEEYRGVTITLTRAAIDPYKNGLGGLPAASGSRVNWLAYETGEGLWIRYLGTSDTVAVARSAARQHVDQALGGD